MPLRAELDVDVDFEVIDLSAAANYDPKFLKIVSRDLVNAFHRSEVHFLRTLMAPYPLLPMEKRRSPTPPT